MILKNGCHQRFIVVKLGNYLDPPSKLIVNRKEKNYVASRRPHHTWFVKLFFFVNPRQYGLLNNQNPLYLPKAEAGVCFLFFHMKTNYLTWLSVLGDFVSNKCTYLLKTYSHFIST